jgi:predicted dehydrogenase
MTYTLHCERATLDFDLARGAEAMQITESGQSLRVVALDATDGYAVEVGYFLDCVIRGKAPGVVTARDNVVALEICEAEERSVRSGVLVSL